MNPSERFPISLGEAIFTLRAIRRFKNEPIDNEIIKDILLSATQAPSGGNSQPWHFLVVKDKIQKEEFAELYHQAWWAKRADQGIYKPEDIAENNKTTLSAMKLSDEIATAPAIILVCATAQGSGPMGSVIPAVQNLLLTARSLGIGGTITTLHPSVEDQVKSMFNMPENVQIVYCVPIGYPKGNFGPVQRKPLAEVTSLGVWGEPL
tara:strand:+ start:3199 stop:3819 length:621 start_codon:yes stop_codon:yes gene_type:complete